MLIANTFKIYDSIVDLTCQPIAVYQAVSYTHLDVYKRQIMLGVTYQVLNRVSAHLGLLNDWPPLFSAMMPTVLFLIAALTMLYFVERR